MIWIIVYIMSLLTGLGHGARHAQPAHGFVKERPATTCPKGGNNPPPAPPPTGTPPPGGIAPPSVPPLCA